MLPVVFTVEYVIRLDGVAHEATRAMCPGCEEEDDEESMAPLECFERLLADLEVCEGVNYYHAEEHDVPSYATGLGVVYLHGFLGAKIVFFNEVETANFSIGICNEERQWGYYLI
jgi:hypothetical protein